MFLFDYLRAPIGNKACAGILSVEQKKGAPELHPMPFIYLGNLPRTTAIDIASDL